MYRKMPCYIIVLSSSNRRGYRIKLLALAAVLTYVSEISTEITYVITSGKAAIYEFN